jgi:hypothetical protein
VKKEVDLGPCRPDLVLYDQKGRVVAIIEVVVTHKPEHYVYDHCHNNNISLLIFRLYDSEDLEKLNDKLLYPSGDLICIAPRCSSCKGPLSLRKYYRTDIDCWKCNAQVPAGVISAGKVVLLPNEFNSMDKDIFGQHGVLLVNNNRKGGGGFSVACRMCGAWDGRQPYIAKYSRGKDKKPVAEVLWCEKCKRILD